MKPSAISRQLLAISHQLSARHGFYIPVINDLHGLLEPALRQLLRALREFRRDNRPPRPEVPPQP